MLFCPSVSVLVCLIFVRHLPHICLIVFNLYILCIPSVYWSAVCGEWVYFVFIYYGYQFSRIPTVIRFYLVSSFFNWLFSNYKIISVSNQNIKCVSFTVTSFVIVYMELLKTNDLNKNAWNKHTYSYTTIWEQIRAFYQDRSTRYLATHISAY